MYFRVKKVSDFKDGDIESLLNNQIAESNNLDYKMTLPGNTDGEKKEFLADVSSFANASGGFLIYGIKEEKDENNKNTGFPGIITGIGDINIDSEKLRLQQILLDGISPPIQGIIMHDITLDDNKVVLMIGIPNSYSSPHAMWYKKSGKFYMRHGSGKYQVEPQELKYMFQESLGWQSDVEGYIDRRVERIKNNKMFPDLDSEYFVAYHFLPLGRLKQSIDVVNSGVDLSTRIKPYPRLTGLNYRPNLDGFVVYPESKDGVKGYILWLRNGGVEAMTSALHTSGNEKDGDNNDYINALGVNKYVIDTTEAAIKTMVNDFNVVGPFVASLVLHNVRGRIIQFHDIHFGVEDNMFLDDDLIIPPVLIEQTESKTHLVKQLKPLLDTVWQSAGFSEALGIDNLLNE